MLSRQKILGSIQQSIQNGQFLGSDRSTGSVLLHTREDAQFFYWHAELPTGSTHSEQSHCQSLRRSLHGGHRYHSHNLSMADCPSFAHDPRFDAQSEETGPRHRGTGVRHRDRPSCGERRKEPGQQNNSPRFRLFRSKAIQYLL